jgi:hypothetical protein
MANNKYMKDYDPEKETRYLKYLDAKNLFGWAMSQNMPTGGFRWMQTTGSPAIAPENFLIKIY